jgi:hypothetical protein
MAGAGVAAATPRGARRNDRAAEQKHWLRRSETLIAQCFQLNPKPHISL